MSLDSDYDYFSAGVLLDDGNNDPTGHATEQNSKITGFSENGLLK